MPTKGWRKDRTVDSGRTIADLIVDLERLPLDWLDAEFQRLSAKRWRRYGKGVTAREYHQAQAIKAAILAKVLT